MKSAKQLVAPFSLVEMLFADASGPHKLRCDGRKLVHPTPQMHSRHSLLQDSKKYMIWHQLQKWNRTSSTAIVHPESPRKVSLKKRASNRSNSKS